MRSIGKKALCVALCALLTGGAAVTAAAVSKKDCPAPAVSPLEALIDGVVCFSARVFERLRRTDETRLPAPAPLPPTGEPAAETPASEPTEAEIAAETWRCTELTFYSEKTYADPFADVSLDLLLTGNGVRYTLPCFWDGDNVWRARVACPAAGNWTYETVCSDASNAGLHGRTGVIRCAAYTGDLDIYKHGFVTTGAGKKYLTYADGTPFFYLGDTHWSLGDETADMVREICEKRVSQGFTVWQSEPIGEKFDLADGVTAADLPGLRAYDETFAIIAEAGLTHANAQFFFPSSMDLLVKNHGGYTGKAVSGKVDGKEVSANEISDEAKAYLERLSRFWVARYGAYPVIWTLGQEVDNDFYWSDTAHPGWNALNNPYKLAAGYIAEYDIYRHPLTAHQENAATTSAYGNGADCGEKLKVYNNVAASAFRNVPAHTFYAAQWSPSLKDNGDWGPAKDFWYNSQGKPAVDYEGRYCYLWTKNFGARMQGWAAYLNGMYGYGWGGQDTWSYLNPYNEDEDSDDGVDHITAEEKRNAAWQDALEYPSAYQAGYMRAFLEDGRWWELIPRFDNKGRFLPKPGVYAVCASAADGSETVLYFYSFSDPTVAERTNTTARGGRAAGTVGHLVPREIYRYQWFDPVNGVYGPEGTFRASALGTWSIGGKPSATDWALRISRGQ